MRHPTHPLRQARRDAAAERQAERNKRTVGHQLAILDKRPGNSTKERARLNGTQG